MKYIWTIFLVGCIALIIPSCDIINPAEQVPAYISVDTIQIHTNNSTEGSAVHNISDCWLYVGGELIGVFEVPFSVPVLQNGNKEIIIQAGIKNNGSQSNRIVYPFLSDYTTQVSLSPEEDILIEPIFEYMPATFELIEDFEDLGINFEITDQSDTIINLISDSNAQEGTSMAFYLDSNRDAFECKTSELYVLPQNSPVYAEISFKCNSAFTFGLFARKYSGGNVFEERIPIITMNQTNEWKTIYVELTDKVVSETTAYDFRLFFTCVHTDSAENSSTQVFIDNVKLIHY
jgi:hypothetical protein